MQHTEVEIFRFFNGMAGNPIFDNVILFISERNVWIGFSVLLILIFSIKKNKRGLKFLLTLGVVVGVTDAFCFNVLKPAIARDRPCHALEDVNLVQPRCGSQHGLPSNHAANGMAIAGVTYLFFGTPIAYYVLTMTILVAISRMYLGVHFPGDLLLGFLVGGSFALLAGVFLRKWAPNWLEVR